MNCKEITPILAQYLKDHFAGETPIMPAELEQHLQECSKCKSVINNPKLAYYFIKMFSNYEQKEVENKAILCHQLIKKPGQIWRFDYGDKTDPQFCAISSKTFNTSDDSPYSVWIIPIKLNPNKNEISKEDLVYSDSETNLNLPILLEAWNKCPIYTSQLLDYHGDFSDEQWEKVTEYITNRPEERLSRATIIFRESEFAKSEKYSECFMKASSSINTLNYSPNSIPWFQKLKHNFNNLIDSMKIKKDTNSLSDATNQEKASIENTPNSLIPIMGDNQHSSTLDSIFSVFNATKNSEKLKNISKNLSDVMVTLFDGISDATMTVIKKSTSSFMREKKKIESMTALAERLKIIENKSDNPEFKIDTEESKLVYILSQHKKSFSIRIHCNECYFDFETNTGELTLSPRRLKEFTHEDITSIEITTENEHFEWR